MLCGLKCFYKNKQTKQNKQQQQKTSLHIIKNIQAFTDLLMGT